MLAVHWIKCIKDKGMTIVFDQISSVKGRIIKWQLDSAKDNQIQVFIYFRIPNKYLFLYDLDQ